MFARLRAASSLRHARLRPRPAPTVALRHASSSSLAVRRDPKKAQSNKSLAPAVTPKTRGHPSTSFAERYIPNLTALYKSTVAPKADVGTDIVIPSGDADAFRRYLKGGRVAQMGLSYRKMMSKVVPGVEPPISVDELRDAVQLVSKAGMDDHWTLLETMLDDLHRIFGSPHTLEDHRAALYFLANSSIPRAAFPRLETIPVDVPITATDFNIVLSGLSRAGDLEALSSCMEQLPLLDIEPDQQTLILLLKGLFNGHAAQSTSSGEPVDLPFLRSEVGKALDDLRPRGLPEDPEVWAAMAEGYLQVGDEETSRKAANALRSALRHTRYENLEPTSWNSLIRCTSLLDSSDKALREVVAMKEAGVAPDEETITALMASVHVGTLDDVRQVLQQVETVTGTLTSASHWAQLIDQIVHRDDGVATREGLEEALEVYHESRHLAVEPTSEIILPLIATLCNPRLVADGSSRESDLNVALGLYDDLLAAEQERYLKITSNSPAPIPFTTDTSALLSPRSEPFGPSVEVYDILLEGISSTRSLKTHDQAWELLGDMEARGLYFETAPTVRHIQAFMSRATTHKYAFSVYDRFLKLHPPSLGASKEAFLTITRQFIQLSFPPELVVPNPRLIAEFITDMRRAGFEESHAVMATYFTQLAKMAYTGAEMSTREDNKDIMMRAQWTTRLAVAWTRVDPFIQMDRSLLNAMMNALTRSGSMTDAYTIWQLLSESDQFDTSANNASVNIIFDAAGLHGNPHMIEHLWKWLRDGAFPLTVSNWHSLVQACLRVGALDHLVRYVTVDMKQNLGHPPAPSPTADTLRLILAYQDAFPDGVLDRNFLRKAVETNFPEMWDEVKDTPAKDWYEMEMQNDEREMDDAIQPLLEGSDFEDGSFADWEAGLDRAELAEELEADERSQMEGQVGQEERPRAAAGYGS